MTTLPNTTSVHLVALWRKVDDFFARALAAHGASCITCHAGCDDCCQRRFSVTRVEADALRVLLATLPAERRAQLRDRALRDDTRCPGLDDDGRCAVYDARPVICRTHGLALRFRGDARHLPLLDTCPRNYRDARLDALDATTVLDQTTLSTMLAAIDGAWADASGHPRGERVDVAALLTESPPHAR